MSESFWDTVEAIADTREANIETWLVLPLLEALGHDRSFIDTKVPVLFQEGRHRRPGRKPEADFVVYAERPFSRANSLITIETKRSSEQLGDGKEQGESYAQNLRTPILMLTNGLRLELWQIQPSSDSVLVFECDVTDLSRRRGDIESILQKEAIKAHCSGIEHKKFDILAQDFGAYEIAQYEHSFTNLRLPITRKIVGIDNKRIVSSDKILSSEFRGAVIVGSSGYGKSTLAASLIREGFERRWKNASNSLPISVFLPDAVLSGRAIEDFLVDRIASHKPGFTLAMFRTVARQQGILVIADAFERVASEHRDQLEAALRTLLLDYPKTKLFVTSRAQAAPSGLGLPIFQLCGYEIEDLRELALTRSMSCPSIGHAFIGAPDHVYKMAKIPLLADLILDQYSIDRQYIAQIASLYEAWLARILAASRPADRAMYREILAEIAMNTTSGPIPFSRAAEICQYFTNSQQILNILVDSDDININGSTVEISHEGLADYFRSLRFWNDHQHDYHTELSSLVFDASSQFPILLVAMGPNADARGEAWQAIIRKDMQLAIHCLRFAAGSEIFSNNSEFDAKRILTDIHATIEILVATNLEPVGNLIRKEIAGVNVERLGIQGVMGLDDISYSFFSLEGGAETVRLLQKGERERAPKAYGHALRRVGYGPEAGRIIGVERIREALATLMKSRQYFGGKIWAEERVFGRLRHLAKKYGAPVRIDSLQEAYDILKHDADCYVIPDQFSAGQRFSMKELLNEIEYLIKTGLSSISQWWDDFDTLNFRLAKDKRAFARTIDEYHRRRQIAYEEVFTNSFPNLAPYLQTFRMMPMRYEIEAKVYVKNGIQRVSINHRRWPVQTFQQAGDDVSFPKSFSDWDSDQESQSYVDQTDALLKRFNRWFETRNVEWGASYRMLDLHGRDTTFDGNPDESVVVRGAMDFLKKDLDKLLSEMPSWRLTR